MATEKKPAPELDPQHQGILDRVKAAQKAASEKNKERDAAAQKAAKKEAGK